MFSKFIKILAWIISAAVILLICTTLYHQIMKSYEHGAYPAPGKMVDVNGEKMHVYSKGTGDKTIVLMTGYGTSSPVVDFTPLTDELSKKFKVVVAEPFGYGWSDRTKKERTVENIIEELRTALQKAGYNPPYVLLPHSFSGIYARYYADKYPSEVSAVIGEDISVPVEFKIASLEKKSFMSVALSEMGLTRAAGELNLNDIQLLLSSSNNLGLTYISDKLKLDDAQPDEYPPAEKSQDLARVMSYWNTNNITVVNELNMFDSNINKVENIRFNKSLPVLLFISRQSIDLFNKIPQGNWVGWHEDLIKGLDKGKCITLEGEHYLHWRFTEEMVKEIEDFLK